MSRLSLRDPVRAARERLLQAEQRERAQAEERAVSEGVAETVALSRARGQAIAEPDAKGRRGPYRRQTGLDFLEARGRISKAAKAAGEHYGWAYRRARADPSIPSTLDVRPGGGLRGAPDLAEVRAHGEGTEHARRKLQGFQTRLWRNADLIAACDLVCGEEKTPREAAGGEREAARLEAVLKVALDVLASGAG